MEDNYSVIWKVHNKNTDAWATQVAWSGSEVRQAKSRYHGEFSRLTGSEDFDFVMVLLTSAWGNTQADFLDERPGAGQEGGWPVQFDNQVPVETNVEISGSETESEEH